jgi:hypothetical protein
MRDRVRFNSMIVSHGCFDLFGEFVREEALA